MKKPRLNQTVYLVHGDCISREHVLMKGKDYFATECVFNDMYMESYRQPLRYDEFGIAWTTDLAEAKRILTEDLQPGEKIVKVFDDYWEVRGKE